MGSLKVAGCERVWFDVVGDAGVRGGVTLLAGVTVEMRVTREC